MSAVVVFAALALVARPGATDRAADQLLERARAAQKSGDSKSLELNLRRWATLRPRAVPPADLAAEAATALSWAADHGALNVFASRVGKRLQVGINDPAGLVAKIACRVDAPDGFALAQAAGGLDRYVFKIPPLAEKRPIVVEAFTVMDGSTLLVGVARLADQTVALPTAPTAPPPPAPAPPPNPALLPDPAPWWIIVAGVVAVGLAGAGVWTQTRN